MNRFFAIVLAFAVFVAGCLPLDLRVAEPNLINPLADATAALVKERASVPGTFRPYCSAVWISDDEMVTAAHCVEDEPDLEQCLSAPDFFDCVDSLFANFVAVSPLGKEVQFSTLSDGILAGDKPLATARIGKVSKYDRLHDLALVKAVDDPGSHTIALLSDRDPVPGEVVHIMGHTKGMLWSYTPGVVGATRVTPNHNGDPVHVVQVVCGASYGNSGGGLFSGRGELLGIGSFLLEDTPIVFFIHRDQIKAFLDK